MSQGKLLFSNVNTISKEILDQYNKVLIITAGDEWKSWNSPGVPYVLAKNPEFCKELAPHRDLIFDFWENLPFSEKTVDKFDSEYVPWFLREMTEPKSNKALQDLYNDVRSGQNVCCLCVCYPGDSDGKEPGETAERKCHRYILAGILKGFGLENVLLDNHEPNVKYANKYAQMGGFIDDKMVEEGISQDVDDEINDAKLVANELDAANGSGKTICFTGPRPNKKSMLSECGYKKENYNDFVLWLKDKLIDLYNDGVRNFISGGAQGFDQLAFWSVHLLKTETNPDGSPKYPGIQNIVYCPNEEQSSKWVTAETKKEYDTTMFHTGQYKAMLNCADQVKIISKDTGLKSLFERNEAMINDSDMVVALYPDDDSFMTAKGGTASAMQYAKKKNVPIQRISFDIDDGVLLGRDITMVDYASVDAKINSKQQAKQDMIDSMDDDNTGFYIVDYPSYILNDSGERQYINSAYAKTTAKQMIDTAVKNTDLTKDGAKVCFVVNDQKGVNTEIVNYVNSLHNDKVMVIQEPVKEWNAESIRENKTKLFDMVKNHKNVNVWCGGQLNAPSVKQVIGLAEDAKANIIFYDMDNNCYITENEKVYGLLQPVDKEGQNVVDYMNSSAVDVETGMLLF